MPKHELVFIPHSQFEARIFTTYIDWSKSCYEGYQKFKNKYPNFSSYQGYLEATQTPYEDDAFWGVIPKISWDPSFSSCIVYSVVDEYYEEFCKLVGLKPKKLKAGQQIKFRV